MKITKRELLIIISLVLIIIFIDSVYSITANIGNARAVIRAKTGDVLDRTILIRNINDESVEIEIFSSGDLEKYTKILDNNFTLQPGEERNARFTIKVAKEGTTETQLNVQFTPTVSKNGVGLSSTIIIIAEKGEEVIDDEGNEDIIDNNETTNIIKTITGKIINENNNVKIIVVIVSLILMVILVILLVLSKKNSKRGLEEVQKMQGMHGQTKPKKSSKQ